jgi:hypothetical protein
MAAIFSFFSWTRFAKRVLPTRVSKSVTWERARYVLVLRLLLLLVIETAALERVEVTAALETLGSNEALDLRCLGVGLCVLLLRTLHLPANDVLADIILLAQVEEATDLGRTLGAETLGQDVVGQAGDIVITLLDDNDREDGDVGADDASTDGLALALTRAASTVA